jgi:hypothetical protein
LTRKQKVLIFVLVLVIMSSIILGPLPFGIVLLVLFFSAVYSGAIGGAAHDWVRRRYDEGTNKRRDAR